MQVIALRIALVSIVLGIAGMEINAEPLVWLSLALGLVGVVAFIAALRGAA